MSVDYIVHKGAHHINEAINATNGVISVRFIHIGHFDHGAEDLIIPETRVQVHIVVLYVAASQVDSARLRRNAPRIQGHLKLHIDLLFLEYSSFDSENLTASLIPLKRVQSLRQLRTKTTLNVVIDSQILLDQVNELGQNLIWVLIQQPLQLAHLLIIIEVFLILGIQFHKHLEVVPQRLQQMLIRLLLRHIGCHLELFILLLKPLVKLWQFRLNIIFDVLLLIPHNLHYFVFEAMFRLLNQFFELIEHRIHQRRQIFNESLTEFLSFLDLLL